MDGKSSHKLISLKFKAIFKYCWADIVSALYHCQLYDNSQPYSKDSCLKEEHQWHGDEDKYSTQVGGPNGNEKDFRLEETNINRNISTSVNSGSFYKSMFITIL